MRARFSALTPPVLALTATTTLFAIVGVACGTAPADPGVGEESSGLARREIDPTGPVGTVRPPRDAGVKDAAPPPTTRPQEALAQFPNANVLSMDVGYCTTHRYDLRRRMPSATSPGGPTCRGLPGVVVENGEHYLYGTGGRYKIDLLPVAAAAPTALKERSCRFTWQGACSAPPDTPDRAKLAISYGEYLIDRDPQQQLFFGGTGHCGVCGYVSHGHLWAVLPPDYQSYSYWIGNQRYFGQADLTTPATGVDEEESSSLPADFEGDVDLDKSAPFR